MINDTTRARYQNIPTHRDFVSWVHFGDLHLTTRNEQNYRDFQALIDEVNLVMRDSVDFAYLPGDNADHGAIDEYKLVRQGVDRLQVPWLAIVGDHDAHERSHDNFVEYLTPHSFQALEVSGYCFFALDAFAFDNPNSAEVFGHLSLDPARY